MDKTTHEIRLANWKQLIEQCTSRPKGQTIQQWLKEHGIAEKQYLAAEGQGQSLRRTGIPGTYGTCHAKRIGDRFCRDSSEGVL